MNERQRAGAERHLDGTARPRAFILTGALAVVCRDPIYIDDLRRRDLKVLVITATAWHGYAEAHRDDPAHPASAIEEVAFVDGSVESEGSFLPGVIEHAGRWREKYDVVGIYAVGETLVEPTGLVADYFDLPFPGLRAARACRSKYLQRWYLPDLSPASVLIPPGARESVDLGSVRFPAVVKPATRHSSQGVCTVHDRAELAVQLHDYPAQETILVEQKITGQEYSVESLNRTASPCSPRSRARRRRTSTPSISSRWPTPCPPHGTTRGTRCSGPTTRCSTGWASRTASRTPSGGSTSRGRPTSSRSPPDPRRRDHGAVPTRDGPADGARDPADRARRACRLSRGPALRTPGVRRAAG